MTDDYLDLSSLSDEELVAQIHDDLYDGLADEVARGTRILLERGWSSSRVLEDALVEGMRIVGDDFRDGILFVPEVLRATHAMKAGIGVLRPLMLEEAELELIDRALNTDDLGVAVDAEPACCGTAFAAQTATALLLEPRRAAW